MISNVFKKAQGVFFTVILLPEDGGLVNAPLG
jgi:hypothetical protein